MNHTVSYIDREDCTGCAMCAALCPKGCITMSEDSEGFCYPVIDEAECIKCGICYKKCPTNTRSDRLKNISTFAAYRGNEKEILTSASGGVSAVIVEQVLRDGGVVYGCVLDSNLIATHIRIENEIDAKKIRGSKYVQSDFSSVYRTILEDCESKRTVVVIGTPCQLEGLKNFLSRDYDNIIYVDLVCHGVPSPSLFKSYLSWKTMKLNQTIKEYYFRDKSKYGWGCNIKIVANQKLMRLTGTRDPYFDAFVYSETFRESCYRCRYAVPERVGDLSICDYWGIEKEHLEWSKDIFRNGISAILVNSQKGMEYLEHIEKELILLPSTLKQVANNNESLYQCAKRPRIRNIFYKKVDCYGFKWANRRMYRLKRYYINLGKDFCPQSLKKVIKKLTNL